MQFYPDLRLSNVHGFNSQIEHTFRVFINEPLMNLLQPLVEQDSEMGKCNIEFQICPDNEDRLFQDLSLQKVDLAIDVALSPTPSYNSEVFYQDEAFVTARKAHPRIHGEINLQGFYAEKHITVKVRRIQSHMLSHISKESVQERIISCETSSLLSLLGQVSNSDCIGLASKLMLNQYEKPLNLQRIKPPFDYKAITYHMVWHKRNEKQPAQLWLRDKLKNLLALSQALR